MVRIRHLTLFVALSTSCFLTAAYAATEEGRPELPPRVPKGSPPKSPPPAPSPAPAPAPSPAPAPEQPWVPLIKEANCHLRFGLANSRDLDDLMRHVRNAKDRLDQTKKYPIGPHVEAVKTAQQYLDRALVSRDMQSAKRDVQEAIQTLSAFPC